LSSSALLNVSRAYANKVKYFKAPTIEETIEAIRQEVMSPRLNVIHHSCMGTGSQLILSGQMDDPRERDLLTFGINANISNQLVEVSRLNKNRNLVDFFAQAAFGTCVKSVNKHLLFVNEQVNEALDLSGDY
ncbi:MAG: hypothetical protein ACRCZB_09000, partial [Bacteroidales bacterium]